MSEPVELRLLGDFRLFVAGGEVLLPLSSRRVIAYLAICPGRGEALNRNELAEHLWVDLPRQRAYAILRTAIWRIRQANDRCLLVGRQRIQLGPAVQVDFHESMSAAQRLLSGDEGPEVDDTVLSRLRSDLLPGWEDDWLLLERERIHQIRILALEALARKLCRLGHIVPALNAAYSAIASEPLRESARAVLVDLQLVQGNIVEACKQVEEYSRLLWLEMKLHPSEALLGRITEARGAGDAATAEVDGVRLRSGANAL